MIREINLVKEKIEKDFDVDNICVFGSFSTGEFDEDSDVDILVEFKSGKKTFNNLIGLENFLEDLLCRDVETKRKVYNNLTESEKKKVINI